ncbi:hypothetical protein E6H14_06500 [Candidatus Bathyarchaeota archaeon]|nr:MAG: hypothetical protein E6H14_06500 [Candidatus Bathyarchaeota archaeon]
MARSRSSSYVTIQVSYDTSIRSSATARKFFENFESLYPELEFRLMGQWEPLKEKYSLERAIALWQENKAAPSRGQYGDSIFHGKVPAPFYVISRWFGTGTHPGWSDTISVMLHETFWTQEKLQDPSGRAVELMKELAVLSTPLYGRGYAQSEFNAKDYHERTLPDGGVSRESVTLTPPDGLVDLYWMNYFGKPYVRILGKETLAEIKSTVSERVGEGYLLVLSPDPFRWNEPETRALQKAARAVMNPEVFLDHSKSFEPRLNIPRGDQAPNSRMTSAAICSASSGTG